MSPHAVDTRGLVKRFGTTTAVDGVDLVVPHGAVYGLLGPNGAGKTTIVRLLTTLVRPDEGVALVDGIDVCRDPDGVRRRIGLTGQYAAVEERLTGRENMNYVARLFHMPKPDRRARADELLERFDLVDAADRVVKTYSGGMRRRLDIAMSLIARPSVLFLDEPTTGLDPRSRMDVWAFIRELQADGTTLLLTTQYLEEADQLADRIAVIDVGTVIAEGTSDELKERVGGAVLEVHVEDREQTGQAATALKGVGREEPTSDLDAGLVRVPVGVDGSRALTESVRRLDDADIALADIALHRPTLDDVFLSLTGRAVEDGSEAEPPVKRGRRTKRSRDAEEARA